MVLREYMLFRVNVQLRQITELQGYFKSIVELKLLLIVYPMHYVYMGKKSQWKTGILKIDLYILKMTHLTLVNLEV